MKTKKPTSSVLSLCLVAVLATTLVSHSQTTRIITDTNGRSMQAKLVSKTDTTVAVIRSSDSARFVISLATLSASDQEFIRAWNPQEYAYKASSVSLRPNSGAIQRESYPSLYKPRYSSGGGGRSAVTWTRSCTYVGSVTRTCK